MVSIPFCREIDRSIFPSFIVVRLCEPSVGCVISLTMSAGERVVNLLISSFISLFSCVSIDIVSVMYCLMFVPNTPVLDRYSLYR